MGKLTESGALWYDAGAPRGALGAVTYGGWPHSLDERGWFISLRLNRRGVRLMGWKLLRFLLCLIMVLWIMVYIAPKAC